MAGAEPMRRPLGRRVFWAKRKPSPETERGQACGVELLWTGIFLLLAVFEAEAVSVHFQNVNMMSQPIQQCTGQSLRSKDLRPLSKWQVTGHQCRRPLVTLTEDFKQHFSTRLR